MKILFTINLFHKVNSFHISSIEAAEKLGYEFHIAANTSNADRQRIEQDEKKYKIKIYNMPFKRNPFNLKNIKAYFELVKLIKREKYDVIHCNTPIGGLLGRLAAKKCKVKTVIYTAHGFHFYKGAPLKNWLLYYTAEKYLARYTDIIITMNKEDYQSSQKFRCPKKYYIPGVGIDIFGIKEHIIINNLREELKIPGNSVLIVSVGEINKNKNQKVIIKALTELRNSNIYYIACGKGKMQPYLKKLAQKCNIIENVKFLGYRTDIIDILKQSDVFCMPSFREGLPCALMEAMAAGLPCIVSKIRGNVDLIEEGKGGYIVKPNDYKGFSKAIKKLVDNKELRIEMGNNNKETAKQCDVNVVKEKMMNIYKDII